ncbi:hypothetical protein P7C73_g1650, partial [Tremellales sp. Uapishka_1]
MTSIASHPQKALFPPFHFSSWKAVDDRVRGGSSISHLEPITIDSSVEGARFWGNLGTPAVPHSTASFTRLISSSFADIETLGGAGFASQRYIFGPRPLSLPLFQYQGIQLDLSPCPSHCKEFTLVLKTSLSSTVPRKPRTPPIPQPASLSYEHNFRASPALASAKRGKVGLRFEDFAAVYRGKEVKKTDPRYEPFDSTKIYELSVMCRSGFGRQSGDFDLVILGIEGWARERELDVGAGREEWAVWKWLGGWWSWFRGLWRSDGMIRLDDEKTIV